MGNEQSVGNPSDLESMKKYTGMSPGQVNLIKEKFELMADEDLTIDKSGFMQLMKLKENEVDKVFQLFDLANDGRIDSHEFVCALALLSQANFREKSEIIFSLYDFDHNRTITKNELVILIKTTLTALGAMSMKGECTIQEAEQKAEALLRKYDTNKDSTISLQEFFSMVSKDSDILKMFYSYGIISMEDMRTDFGGADIQSGEMPEPDSDIERENSRNNLAFDQKTEKKLVGVDHKQGVNDDGEEIKQVMSLNQFQNNRKNISKQWYQQVKSANPTQWKPGRGDACPPVTWLDLEYIYGFRCFDTRNNIKFTTQGEIVYPVAAVGVALDIQKNTQKFFLEHTDDVTCIDVYENRIATGQVGSEPMICVWEVGSVSRATFRGIIKQGVSYINFSNDGSKLVAVGMDSDHCIVVYDIDRALGTRGQGRREDSLIASGKGPRSDVFDVKFDKVDKMIVLACKNEVYFASYDNYTIKLTKGVWDSKTCPISSVLCIGTVEQNVVTGTFKGQLLVWRGSRATQSIEQHKGAVLSMYTRKSEPGVITGGRDGTIIIWDGNLKPRNKIILQELNLKIFNLKISTVSENYNGSVIVIGTRGSDIVEISGNKSRIIMRGHSEGHLRGLTVHSKLQQFYTIGEDNLLACWSIKERKMLSSVRLDYPSRALNISIDSRFLAVGSLNGTIIIIDPKTLIPTFNFKDRDAEVSCIKFSHDTEILAVGHASPTCEIILYSIKNHFKKTNVLRGSPSTILSIDFSINCRILQVNDYSCQVLYYEVPGEGNQRVQPDGAQRNRDEKWASYTAIYGWHVQGIWPEVSSGNDINAVDRSQHGEIIVTADDYSSIKLFRFPAALPRQGYLRYSGHSAHVSNIKFTADDEYIISLGGVDKSIFQWKFNFDKETQTELDLASDQIPDYNIQNEYLITKYTDLEERHEAPNKQYLGPVKATVPTSFKPDYKRDNQLPNGSLQLSYILGLKTTEPHQEALNLIKYTQNNKVVYPVGTTVVVMDMKPDRNGTRTQSFFRQHTGDISVIAINPKRNLVATGQRAFGLKLELVPIYIWDVETKQILANICDFHLRSINAIAFTPDGAFLVSIGGDDDYSLTVHDWTSNQLLCTTKTGRSFLNSVVIKSQTEFITCGLKSVKFFTMQGRNLKCQAGSVGSQFEPMTVAVIGFPSNECITGSISGNLYLWKDSQAQRPLKAHEGKVTALCSNNKNVYSAGLDGRVLIYALTQGQLQFQLVFETSKLFKTVEQKIIAIDILNDMMVCQTANAELWEIILTNQPKAVQVSQGHFGGELWGLACSPNQNRIVTCGGDQLLRAWDLDTKKMIAVIRQPLENDFRAVDWSSDGHLIVVGDTKGIIYLFEAGSLNILDKKPSKFSTQKMRNNMVWIQEIKFSPDSTKIAFGAHVAPSHLEVWEIEAGRLNKQKLINLSLSGSLIHLDWALDNVHLVVNSSNYELKFVNVIKEKDVPGPTVKDLDWASWTCVLGFPVQGVYKSKDEYDVTSICANHQKNILATGEFNGNINLYRYPVVITPPPQVHRQYHAHSSRITRLRFTHDDSMLISISNLDRSIMIWSTDFSKQQILEQEERYEDDDGTDLTVLPKVRRYGAEKYGKAKRKDQQIKQEDDENEHGDDFVQIKPWMGALKEPSNYYKDPLNQNKEPRIEASVEYVYGYRGRDSKNNLRYLKNGTVVYHSAALGIVLDIIQNTQRFFSQHDDDIICLDVHPDGIKVATGQIGEKASIYVWDSNTQQTICCFKGLFTKGISCLAFNISGDKLTAIGIDDQHTIGVYDIVSKSKRGGVLLLNDNVGPEVVTDVRWKNENEFVTVGINLFKSWAITVGGFVSKKGILCKTNSTKYLSLVFNGEDCVVSASDGTLQIYKNNVYVQCFQLHEGKPIDALQITKDFLLSGGRDCKIQLIETKGTYKSLITVKLPEIIKGAMQPEIKSVTISPDLKCLLIGTSGSEIYEIATKDAKITMNSKFTQPKTLMRSHYWPNKRSLNEIWGLAVNPNDHDQFYTCSDDGTLRSWSISQKKMINQCKTNQDQNGNEIKPDENGELGDSIKGRSIGVSHDGVYVVVGFKDGTVRVYDKELKQKMVMKAAKEWISDIKFSHDSSQLAIGSHDNNIYIYTFPDMKLKNKPLRQQYYLFYNQLRKHQQYITHIDFSQDGNYLHSNCGGYELLFWDVNQGKQITLGSMTLRDEKWNTWTATLGWPVQGIWPEIQDESEINTVDRSHHSISGSDKPPDNYYLLASGDDNSLIKIFRYPCIKKGSKPIIGKGHSSHITNVRFSMDDSCLLSTGGEDNTIIQWKIQKILS